LRQTARLELAHLERRRDDHLVEGEDPDDLARWAVLLRWLEVELVGRKRAQHLERGLILAFEVRQVRVFLSHRLLSHRCLLCRMSPLGRGDCPPGSWRTPAASGSGTRGPGVLRERGDARAQGHPRGTW